MKELLLKYTKTTQYCSDEEVKQLIAYYKNLLKALEICPEIYFLVKLDARKELEQLNEWKTSRKGGV